MNFDRHNLRGSELDDVFAEAERAFDLKLKRDLAAFGSQGASVGFPTSQETWVHFTWRLTGADNKSEETPVIPGVRKPELYRVHRWQDATRKVFWRASESEWVRSAVVDPSGVITTPPHLSDRWWNDLSSSLASLALYATPSNCVDQNHLDLRINDVFGDMALNTENTEWVTAHGDLHWGNVTAPECHILDWESCGRGPRGLDAATLWGHSLLVPQITQRIQEKYAADLNSRSGLLSQLMFCANVIRLARKKATPGPLVEPATRESDRILAKLSLS